MIPYSLQTKFFDKYKRRLYSSEDMLLIRNAFAKECEQCALRSIPYASYDRYMKKFSSVGFGFTKD